LAYIVRCEYPSGAVAWLKRSHPTVLWGPREQAQSFPTRSAAERAMTRHAGPDCTLSVEAGVAASAEPASTRRAKTVLIVEDDVAFAYAVSKMLLRAGFAVLSAPDGVRAMAMIEERACVDLLLADIRLPSGTPDGVEVARLVQERCPNTKVLFVSAYRDAAARGGRVLHKPIALRTLVAEVERTMAA
jgi:CheY-like chemotaxis protein